MASHSNRALWHKLQKKKTKFEIVVFTKMYFQIFSLSDE